MHHPTRRPSVPADLVTYRLNNKLVYVPPAKNYEEALDFAFRVFPDDLYHVARHRISFSISVHVKNELRSVRISPMAWSTVAATLHRYEIIDLAVQPEVIVQDMSEAPPQYPISDSDSKEDREFYQSQSNSCPSSRASSPAAVPPRITRSVSSERGTSRTWFGKHL